MAEPYDDDEFNPRIGGPRCCSVLTTAVVLGAWNAVRTATARAL
jgi:hypothetical protein